MYNKVVLVGNVAKDPQSKTVGELKITQFSVATNAKKDHTEWFNVVCFNKLADTAERFVKKGSLLFVEGRLETKTYTAKDGQKKTYQQTLADNFKLLNKIDKPKQESLFDEPEFAADEDEFKF